VGWREGGRVEGSVKKYVATPLQITRNKKNEKLETATHLPRTPTNFGKRRQILTGSKNWEQFSSHTYTYK